MWTPSGCVPRTPRRPPRTSPRPGRRTVRGASARRALAIERAGVDLSRAPVDNERARTRAPLEARWKRIGLDHARRRLVEIGADGDHLVVRSRLGLDGSALGADVLERWSGDARG